MMTPEESTRFNAKWTRQGDCHLWSGPLDKDGYGAFYFRRLNRRAHRVGYFSMYGEIDGMIGHTCRNRSCVNPAHLTIVTARQNALENSISVPSMNASKTACPRGHAYDGVYVSKRGTQRTCSICEKAKQKRLRAKWRTENILSV